MNNPPFFTINPRLNIFDMFVRLAIKFFTILQSKDESTELDSQPGDMGDLLLSCVDALKNKQIAIHDITIQFPCSIQQYLDKKKLKLNESNKGILLSIPTANSYRTVKVSIYRTSIQIHIGCSSSPFTCDDIGAFELVSLLKDIRKILKKSTHFRAEIPSFWEWTLTHRHYGIDGFLGLNGEQFHITFKELLGEFTRIYTKTMPGGREILRMEQVQTEKRSVRKEIELMISPRKRESLYLAGQKEKTQEKRSSNNEEHFLSYYIIPLKIALLKWKLKINDL